MHFASALKAMALKPIWLGRVDYGEAMKLQNIFAEKLKRLKACSGVVRNYLLILEHDPVYTVGIRSHFYSKEEEERLKKTGAAFYRTNRGGLITFHGPGQLVVYPIFDLASLKVRDETVSSFKVGVRRFVFLVEEAIIRTLRGIGVFEAARSSDTGVWVGNGTRKIAAIGINVRGGVTSHGLALNCNTDLSWFRKIVPCGLVGKEVTSISTEVGYDVSVTNLVKPISQNFAEVFQCSLENCDAPGENRKIFFES